MNSLGQGSLELMLIAMAVVGMAFVFSSAYLSAQDTTTALLIAKNRISERLQARAIPTIIETIQSNRLGTTSIEIRVFTQPPTVSQLDLGDLSGIQTEIQNATIFETISWQINP